MGDDLDELWKEDIISREVKRESYGRLVIPTVVYGSETWSLSAEERRNIEVYEMMRWRNMCHKESGQSEEHNDKREVRV